MVPCQRKQPFHFVPPPLYLLDVRHVGIVPHPSQMSYGQVAHLASSDLSDAAPSSHGILPQTFRGDHALRSSRRCQLALPLIAPINDGRDAPPTTGLVCGRLAPLLHRRCIPHRVKHLAVASAGPRFCQEDSTKLRITLVHLPLQSQTPI